LPATATARRRIKAKSFPMTRRLRWGRRLVAISMSCAKGEAAHPTMIYAFDLIEHDGDELRDRPFLERKTALARLLRNTGAGVRLNEHIAEDGPTVFAHACLAMRASFESRSTALIVQRERSEI
jgi:hypothetical protein